MKSRQIQRTSRLPAKPDTSSGNPLSHTASPNNSVFPTETRSALAAATRWQMALLLLLILFTAQILTFQPVTDSDFWHHLAFGRIVTEQGHFPTGDDLSSTAAGRPWISSGWIPAVLIYKAYRLPHVNGVGILLWLLIGMGAVGMFAANSIRRSSPVLVGLLVLLALGAASPRYLPRPDIFSIVLMVPLMRLLVWYQEEPLLPGHRYRAIWRAALFPLLFLVWANCHMLFVIGFAIATLFVGWACLQWKRNRRHDAHVLLVAWAAAGLACLATPYGLRAYWFIAENAHLHATGTRINELKPLWSAIGEPASGPIMGFLALWLAACGWLLWQQRAARVGWWRWCAIAFLVTLVLVQRRQIGIAVFGITPLVIVGISGSAIPVRRFRSSAALILPLIVVILLYLNCREGKPIASLLKTESQVNCEWFPCEAMAFLKNNPPPQRLFHDLYTGGYLAYNLAPATKVFIDGRLEVYNNGTFDDFFAPPEGRAPLDAILKKYHVHSAFLDWRQAAAQPGSSAAILAQRPDWNLCWFSDHYALFVHIDDATTSYTAAHAYRFLNPLNPDPFMLALQNPATAATAQAEACRATRENPDSYLAKKAMSVAGIAP